MILIKVLNLQNLQVLTSPVYSENKAYHSCSEVSFKNVEHTAELIRIEHATHIVV